MRRQAIPKVSTGKDQKQAATHQEEYARPAMSAITKENRKTAKCSDKDGENAMNLLLRGEIVRPHCQKGDSNRCENAMNEAEHRGDNPQPVGLHRQGSSLIALSHSALLRKGSIE